MSIVNRLSEAIYELEHEGCYRTNLRIVGSIVLRHFLEEEIRGLMNFNTGSETEFKTLEGVKISFEHFDNEFVIYDYTRPGSEFIRKVTFIKNHVIQS